MIIFIVHNKGNINGAKKISNEIIELAKKENIHFKISPYPHNFKPLKAIIYLVEYFSFLAFHINNYLRSTTKTIYFTGSNNSIGFIKDLPVLIILNILYKNEKKIIHFHSSDLKLNKYLKNIFRFLYRNWIHIYLGEKLVPKKKPSNYHIIQNYTEIKKYNHTRKNSNKINIGYFGSYEKFKGIDDYILISNKFKTNLNLNFYSAGRGDLNRKKYNFKNLGELKNSEDISSYLSSLDILIYPSYWDAQPLSILEAFYFDTVVIAYNVGSISEMISNTKDVVEVGNTQSIIDRINYYISHKNQIKKIKIQNKKQIELIYNKNNFRVNVKKIIFNQ